MTARPWPLGSLLLLLAAARPAPAQGPRAVILAKDRLADAAARRVLQIGRRAIARHGTFNLVLAGGSTPRGLYTRLASPELKGRLDWSRVHFFFGDERMVEPSSPESNFQMARETLLDEVPIQWENVHRIEGEGPPAEAARAYARTLLGRRLDLVLLGMGGDGHTASLFPGTDHAATREAVVVTESPAGPRLRVSLSLGTLNRAEHVMFLVAGADKAARVAEALGARPGARPVAAQVQPKGWLRWYLDEAAAAELR